MRQIVIPMHSVVDVITNSSTVIYVSAHGSSIKLMKEFINTLLKATGSDKTSDDLFEFSTAVNFEKWSERMEYYYEDEMPEGYDDMEYDEGIAALRKMYDQSVIDGTTEDVFEYGAQKDLVMVVKGDDKLTINLVEQVEAIFEIEEEYNG